MIEYKPVFHSPIAVPVVSSPTTSNLRISDITGVQVTLIQGAVGDILEKQFLTVPNKPGDLVEIDKGLLACLTPQEFYLFGLFSETNLPSALELDDSFSKAKHFAHVTDLTHGRAVLKLTGPTVAEVLSKICGLNFYDNVFSNMQVKQTSAAKIKTLIARHDKGDTSVYYMHVNRPLGQYFWDIVWDAGQEFGIVVDY